MALTARALATSALVLALSPLALSQSHEDTFHRAFYLEHSEHDYPGALELYRKLAGDARAPADVREKARAAAEGIAEDVAADDFARLMPPKTILYVEMNQPGGQLEELLDQLGLLADEGSLARGDFGISPRLLESALGLQGAAFAITQVNPMNGQPGGVAVLHPGRQDLVRGLIETLLPAGGVPVDPIGGHPTWTVEKQAYITMTSRLVIASQSTREIEAVIARLHGEASESLADQPALQHALEHSGQGLVSFCLNPQPLKPLMQLALSSAGADPSAAMAVAALDPHSLRSVGGHVGVDEDGLVLKLGIELAEGHRNLAFNLMRRQSFDRRTLELVPSGAAFFLATAFNPSAGVAPVELDSAEQPVVTAMDFGRELFGNLCDLAIFGLPSTGEASPIPEIAAVMRVNDAQRSRAVWSLVLGLASQATQGAMQPRQSEIAGAAVDTYSIQGLPVHLAARNGELVISPSATALERSLGARSAGASVLADAQFASCLADLPETSTLALVANVRRCAKMAEIHMSEGEREELARVLPMLDATIVSLGVEHSQTRLSVSARVNHVPNVSGLVAQALREWKGQASSARASVARARATEQAALRVLEARRVAATTDIGNEGPATPVAMRDDLAATFESLATVRPHDHAAALIAGSALVQALRDDANALNELAWNLLTEERYGNDFADLALEASQRSNELTDRRNWMFVDTLGLAHFETGDTDAAIETARLAVELAKGQARQPEAIASLERFLAAKVESAQSDE